eukprot:scaffold34574_cov55-Phaeocystis_antarctica.AAC.2
MRAAPAPPPRARPAMRGRGPAAPWSAPRCSPRRLAAAAALPPPPTAPPRPHAAGRSTPPRPSYAGRLPAMRPATRPRPPQPTSPPRPAPVTGAPLGAWRRRRRRLAPGATRMGCRRRWPCEVPCAASDCYPQCCRVCAHRAERTSGGEGVVSSHQTCCEGTRVCSRGSPPPS